MLFLKPQVQKSHEIKSGKRGGHCIIAPLPRPVHRFGKIILALTFNPKWGEPHQIASTYSDEQYVTNRRVKWKHCWEHLGMFRNLNLLLDVWNLEKWFHSVWKIFCHHLQKPYSASWCKTVQINRRSFFNSSAMERRFMWRFVFALSRLESWHLTAHTAALPSFVSPLDVLHGRLRCN